MLKTTSAGGLMHFFLLLVGNVSPKTNAFLLCVYTDSVIYVEGKINLSPFGYCAAILGGCATPNELRRLLARANILVRKQEGRNFL